MNASLDTFGSFFVQHVRDSMFDELEGLLQGASKAPGAQELQRWATGLGGEDKRMLHELVERISTRGMHDLLFALQEVADDGGDVQVLVSGVDVATLSDGLHGELFGDTGWIVRHSRHPSPQQIELSRWAEGEISRIVGGDPEA